MAKRPAGNRYTRTKPLTPFGERLRSLLGESEVENRRALLELTGVPHSTLYRYETDPDAVIPSNTLESFARALGCSVDSLLGLPTSPQEAIRISGHALAGPRLEREWRLAAQAAQRLRPVLGEGQLPLELVDFLIERVAHDVELVRQWRSASEWRDELERADGDEDRDEARRRLTAHLLLLIEEVVAYSSTLPALARVEGRPDVPRLLVDSGEEWDPMIPDPE